MIGKTLIVFATRTGINEDAAVEMAQVLKSTGNADVTVVDLKEGPPDIAPYQNVIVGAGVRGKNVYSEAVDFLAKDFAGKNVAIYFGCEDVENPKMESTEENTKKALAKNNSLKPFDVSAFGGCMISGGRPVLDEMNMKRVQSWAMELAKKFDTQTQPPQQMEPDLLRPVNPECDFRFFTGLEKPTGITASSTVEFSKKLQTAPIESIMFHFQRQDFQKWFRTSVGDDTIANKIDQINIWISGETLRKELLKTAQDRIAQLRRAKAD